MHEDEDKGQSPLRGEYPPPKAAKQVFPGSWAFIIFLLILAGTLIVLLIR